jgi:hypothetical protein
MINSGSGLGCQQSANKCHGCGRPYIRGFSVFYSDAGGGGTRTPDTRIMIGQIGLGKRKRSVAGLRRLRVAGRCGRGR